MTHTIALSIAPRPWLRARVGRSGHFTDAKTRAYKNAVRTILAVRWSKAPLATALSVSMDFYIGPPKRRPGKSKKNHTHPCVKPDIDNFQKAIMDAANGVLWVDDGQLVELRSRKIYDWANRRVGVEIKFSEVAP